jgi:hypothetical protein
LLGPSISRSKNLDQPIWFETSPRCVRIFHH